MIQASPGHERLLLRAEEAALILGIGRSKVFELMAEGEIDSVLIGRRTRRIPMGALSRYVERLQLEATSE